MLILLLIRNRCCRAAGPALQPTARCRDSVRVIVRLIVRVFAPIEQHPTRNLTVRTVKRHVTRARVRAHTPEAG
jgi:hypothetical protein